MIARGRAFLFIATTMFGWTAIRVVSLNWPTPAAQPSQEPRTGIAMVETQVEQTPPAITIQPADYAPPAPAKIAATGYAIASARLRDPPPRRIVPMPISLASAPSALPQSDHPVPIAWPRATAEALPASVLAHQPDIATQADTFDELRRWSLYAYSFWRWPMANPALAPGGQYGGSQSGLIVHYRLWQAARLDARLRLAATPQRLGERELAFGLHWQPMAKMPISLIAERRLRSRAPDAFSLGAAVAPPQLSLPLGFSLESYGQAGWVSGAAGGHYYDGSAHATREFVKTQGIQVSLGGGVWGGGQKGVNRLDAGPRLDLTATPAGVPVRLSADWRFRLTGNALPSNGPALTLSTSF